MHVRTVIFRSCLSLAYCRHFFFLYYSFSSFYRNIPLFFSSRSFQFHSIRLHYILYESFFLSLFLLLVMFISIHLHNNNNNNNFFFSLVNSFGPRWSSEMKKEIESKTIWQTILICMHCYSWWGSSSSFMCCCCCCCCAGVCLDLMQQQQQQHQQFWMDITTIIWKHCYSLSYHSTNNKPTKRSNERLPPPIY